MENSVSVILPTYNESMNIKELVRRLNKSIINLKEIIVVDDNSPDKTGEIAARLKNVKVIIRKNERGVGSAIYRGIQIAKGDIIAWMDADLSMPPEVLPKMISALEYSDVTVGSRYIKGGKDKRNLSRVLTSRAINLFTNIILNFKVLDYDSGFIAAKKHVFERVKFNPQGHGEYCIEFLYKCTKRDLKVKEIPYVFTKRKLGESKSTEYIYSISKFGLMYVIRVLKMRLQKNL